MKKFVTILSVLLMIGLTSFGCKKKEEPVPAKTPSVEDVQDAAEEATDEAKDVAEEAAEEAADTAEGLKDALGN